MEMPIRAFGLCLVVLILAPQVRAAEGNAQVRSEAPEHPLTLTIPEWSEPGPRRCRPLHVVAAGHEGRSDQGDDTGR